ncbi:flippase [Bacillus kexueae]|uniref:flippase n=1 Tax=Aeribacillus kexueae TaxID=2078952 RepID=UPI001FAEA381|nr:flippase [Bacillus kexueae]
MKKNSILSNAIYLFLSNVFVRFFTAASTILIARYLGAEDYGILSVALAYASVAAYFTDLGLTHTLIREGSKPKSSLPVLMSSFFRIRLVLSLLTIFISVGIIHIIYHDSSIKNILLIVLIPTIFGAALQGVGAAYYQVTERMHLTAIIRTVSGLLSATSLLLGMFLKWPLVYIAPVYGLANVIGGILSLVIVMKSINIFKGWDNKLLNGLGTFTISGFTIMLLPQIGPIILERVAGLEEAGYFAAAYRLPAVLYQIPGVIAAAFYPVLFKYANANKIDEHYKLSQKQIKIMTFLGIAMSIPFLFHAEWWIQFLFGEEWLSASSTLFILALMVILQSINYPLADAITTRGMQHYRTFIQLIALCIGVFLYILLGKNFGSIGGAISAVSLEILLLIGFMIVYKKGLMLFLNGVLINCLSFIVVVLINFILKGHLHPLVNSLTLVLLYTFLTIVLDRQLRLELLKLIRTKFIKGK